IKIQEIIFGSPLVLWSVSYPDSATPTGNTLAAIYKPQLTELLKEKLKETDALRKRSQAERKACSSGSSDYQQWDEEYQKYAKIGNQIYNTRKNLDEACQKVKPFSHPFYWAAFTCTGIR
ncbi:hypothetical protein, partial [Microcoleus sp. D2_18a_D3]|uniref:hypothetical protein n=1 Tax=Microcoleus sp. D2_18a_D3 TaxID=3055330 RepID=UPI002FD4EF51